MQTAAVLLIGRGDSTIIIVILITNRIGGVMFSHASVILSTIKGGLLFFTEGGVPFFTGGLPFFTEGGLPFFRAGRPFFRKWEPPPPPIQKYGQCAVGKHPTGMYTCYFTEFKYTVMFKNAKKFVLLYGEQR